jgi:murein DD-endopeptidase MepM/ murein hydrolase activator NlpD
MQKRIFIISLFFINLSSFAQLKRDTLGWIPPVDIPIYLSGNFAELRTGHFHAGIDIKTQGNEGFKVYAVQDGYISRIKVSSGGYGKAVYITHPDSYTSVYGHLKEYNIQLDKYVKAIQYERKSYGVDIFPEKGELAINQGDIIGLSGNSGSSGGPHLHFEIRDTKSARPMNGLFLGYDIEDNIPPKMDYLYVYPQYGRGTVNGKSKDHYYSLKRANADFALRQGDTLTASGSVGLGLKVNDYLNGSANRCGVYELKGFIDDTLFFYEKFDGFSFA